MSRYTDYMVAASAVSVSGSAFTGDPLNISWITPVNATANDGNLARVSAGIFESGPYLRVGPFTDFNMPQEGRVIQYEVKTKAFVSSYTSSVSSPLLKIRFAITSGDQTTTPRFRIPGVVVQSGESNFDFERDPTPARTLTSANTTAITTVIPTLTSSISSPFPRIGSNGIYVWVRELNPDNPNKDGNTNINIDWITVRAKYVLGSAISSPTFGQSTGGATRSWSNPNNITTLDSAFAIQNTMSSAAGDDYLKGFFTFSIPSSASVEGVMTEIVGVASGGSVIFETVRTLDSLGNPVGDDKATGTSAKLCADTSASMRHGASNDLWGRTDISAGLINSGFFGVQYRFYSEPGNIDAKIDHIRMRVHYDLTPTITVNSFDMGHESIGPTYNQTTIDVKSFKLGHEIRSVSLSGNHVLPITRAEFGHQFGSVLLTQVHSVGVQSSEYGHQIKSLGLDEFTFTMGYQVGSPALTQLNRITPVNFKLGYDLQSINIYDPNRIPSSFEYGFEVGMVGLSQVYSMSPARSEFGFDISSPSLRTFETDVTPSTREISVIGETRRTIVNSDNRRITI